ncbi:hypothetical protein PFFCH_04493 [Plasmodium falciparum FCH/4]|uniref:Uncharacterized protein n=1 Tax=Plasmodium falciparum FCH/4 TaxID=1036724 RepID=A0A024VHZ7_PLAFA|nr:hypothetical protein PFFCH_04493 [Plasmodium falciparum FCH/4]
MNGNNCIQQNEYTDIVNMQKGKRKRNDEEASVGLNNVEELYNDSNMYNSNVDLDNNIDSSNSLYNYNNTEGSKNNYINDNYENYNKTNDVENLENKDNRRGEYSNGKTNNINNNNNNIVEENKKCYDVCTMSLDESEHEIVMDNDNERKGVKSFNVINEKTNVEIFSDEESTESVSNDYGKYKHMNPEELISLYENENDLKNMKEENIQCDEYLDKNYKGQIIIDGKNEVDEFLLVSRIAHVDLCNQKEENVSEIKNMNELKVSYDSGISDSDDSDDEKETYCQENILCDDRPTDSDSITMLNVKSNKLKDNLIVDEKFKKMDFDLNKIEMEEQDYNKDNANLNDAYEDRRSHNDVEEGKISELIIDELNEDIIYEGTDDEEKDTKQILNNMDNTLVVCTNDIINNNNNNNNVDNSKEEENVVLEKIEPSISYDVKFLENKNMCNKKINRIRLMGVPESVNENMDIKKIGKLIQFENDILTIQSDPCEHYLSVASVLCLENRKIIGCIINVNSNETEVFYYAKLMFPYLKDEIKENIDIYVDVKHSLYMNEGTTGICSELFDAFKNASIPYVFINYNDLYNIADSQMHDKSTNNNNNNIDNNNNNIDNNNNNNNNNINNHKTLNKIINISQPSCVGTYKTFKDFYTHKVLKKNSINNSYKNISKTFVKTHNPYKYKTQKLSVDNNIMYKSINHKYKNLTYVNIRNNQPNNVNKNVSTNNIVTPNTLSNGNNSNVTMNIRNVNSKSTFQVGSSNQVNSDRSLINKNIYNVPLHMNNFYVPYNCNEPNMNTKYNKNFNNNKYTHNFINNPQNLNNIANNMTNPPNYGYNTYRRYNSLSRTYHQNNINYDININTFQNATTINNPNAPPCVGNMNNLNNINNMNNVNNVNNVNNINNLNNVNNINNNYTFLKTQPRNSLSIDNSKRMSFNRNSYISNVPTNNYNNNFYNQINMSTTNNINKTLK